MKISSLRCVSVAAAVSLLGLAGPAFANAPVFTGTVSATFTDPVITSGNIIDPAAGGALVPLDNTGSAYYTGIGTNSLLWGENPTPGGLNSSTLTFVGKSFSNVGLNDTIDLGTLTYFNGTSATNTLIFGAGLDFSAGVDGVTDATTPVTIDTTSNDGTVAQNADFISFGAIPNLTFNVLEGESATAELYGHIGGDPQLFLDTVQFGQGGGFIGNGVPGVPEPATWAMLILGIGVAGAAMRRREIAAVA